jgi:uncharacterized membrane protein YfcA
LDPTSWSGLAAVAFATSALTAVLGLGGGIVLLAVMLLWLPPLVAIPLHAGIQIFSNASRAVIQRDHVAWPLLFRYALPLAPAGALGLVCARALPTSALEAAIGLFVLVATWWPRGLLFGFDPARLSAGGRFWLLGGLIGFLNPAVGATGPLQGPFFLDLGLSRQGVVGTFAACQTLGHFAKLLLFGAAGFAFLPHLAPLAALGLVVMAGTWVGSRLLDRVDERAFGWLYRGVLTAVAVWLLVAEGLLPLVGAPPGDIFARP